MRRQDFESANCATLDSAAHDLEHFWEQRRLPELAQLGPALAKLASALHRRAQPGEEVSPFVYVMY